MKTVPNLLGLLEDAMYSVENTLVSEAAGYLAEYFRYRANGVPQPESMKDSIYCTDLSGDLFACDILNAISKLTERRKL